MDNAWLQFEWTRPAMLWALLAMVPLGFFFYRSLVDFAPWQRWSSLITRSIIVVLLVIALAGVSWLQSTPEQFVILAVDRSRSVDDAALEVADTFVERATKDPGMHRLGFLDFGAKPTAVRDNPQDGSDAPIDVDDTATDLAAVIGVAAAAIPPSYVPHLVLITDGNETSGDALAAAANTNLRISTIPLPTRQAAEVQVSSVDVPAQVRQGEPFYVDVVIDANQTATGWVDVFRGANRVVSEQQTVEPGENRFRFRQTVNDERLAEFSVRLREFDDTLLDNNRATGLVFAAGRPRVLLIESDPALARHLRFALEEEDVLVDVRPPEGMPASLADLQNYELLALSNVPATALSARQMEVARTYVEELGGGLVMIGGDQSFGLGGYYRTAIEEILPVRSDFEKEKEKPSLAMVLVIDKSGSMGGEKIELAKDAAKGAVELLAGKDKIGVIAFDGETYWISEVHPVNDKRYALERIGTIDAGGGTNLFPAMEEAYLALSETVAKLKHVIILTDGHSAPGDFVGVTNNMAAARITVSTVAVGDGADQALLEDVARLGRGRYYFCDDPLAVPQIFAKETVTASKSAINEQPFLPQLFRPTQVLAEIDFDAAPFLLGYVVTRPKPTSEVILATEDGDPLLVWWRYGLGMTVAFTSDAKGRWAAEWLSWPGFSQFWSQLVRHSMRTQNAAGFQVDVNRAGEQTEVTLDAADVAGRFITDADTVLKVIDPGLEDTELAMQQVAPGRYRAVFPTNESGTYHLEMVQTRSDTEVARQSRGLSVGYADELRIRPTNRGLLAELASQTDGMFDPSPADLFAPIDRTAFRAVPIWPYLVAAALLLWILDVALRRIDFDLALGRRDRTMYR